MDLENEKNQDELESMDELERQKEYMKKVREVVRQKEQEIELTQTYFVFTTGCQMNAHDSEKIVGMMESMGFLETHSEDYANVVIYNTCCIRENAEEKIYGRLGRLKHYKKDFPYMKIVLCGCMTQQDVTIEKLKQSYPYVDVVLGTFNLYKLPELLYNSYQTEGTIFDIWKENKEIIEDLPTVHKNFFSASVNISYGCDNFCSYCIVPYVRGRFRSRQPELILEEIKKLVANGAKEITLLGQNVNSYGEDLKNINFPKLLYKINEIEGLERIRFMTSHPKDLSNELILAMKKCKKVGSYLHLPVQSGSTEILKQMNRCYTKEHYLTVVKKLRSQIEDLHISTDIMVGFPGETEEDFQETLDLIKKVRFSSAFTFIYSKRTGTPAAVMENQIPEDVVKDRFQRLLDVLNPIIHEINKAQVGNVYSVLVEDVSKQNPAILTGRSENNSLIHFKGKREWIGQIMSVRIIDNKTFYLIGERV